MTIRIQPYRQWSGGAKALGERAGILRATPQQVRKHGDFDHIINWGSSDRRFNGRYFNSPEAVALASNKLTTARLLDAHDVPQPPYTQDREVVLQWLREGHSVFARTLLRSHSGRGIVPIHNFDDDIVRAPMYTKYIKKADEYRVHVVDGTVIDIQQKRKRREVPNEEVNYQIRNYRNGWTYCRDGIDPPDGLAATAIRAVGALGLDFGAVDMGYNRRQANFYVFEVNTAPGLEGSTLEAYYGALVSVFPQLQTGAYRRRRNAT